MSYPINLDQLRRELTRAAAIHPFDESPWEEIDPEDLQNLVDAFMELTEERDELNRILDNIQSLVDCSSNLWDEDGEIVDAVYEEDLTPALKERK